MIKRKRIEELANERIAELDKGLYLVDITISNRSVINVEVDALEGSIAIADCVSVSRNIEHNLDREIQDFELSVSSPGLDKPFRVHQQYIKNVGRVIKVLLKEQGSIEGKLIAVDESGIVVETSSKERIEGRKKKELVIREHELSFKNIKETRLIILFK